VVLVVLFLGSQVVNVGQLGVQLGKQGFTVTIRQVLCLHLALVFLKQFSLELIIADGFLMVSSLLQVLSLVLELGVELGLFLAGALNKATHSDGDLLGYGILHLADILIIDVHVVELHVHVEHVVHLLRQVVVQHILVLPHELK